MTFKFIRELPHPGATGTMNEGSRGLGMPWRRPLDSHFYRSTGWKYGPVSHYPSNLCNLSSSHYVGSFGPSYLGRHLTHSSGSAGSLLNGRSARRYHNRSHLASSHLGSCLSGPTSCLPSGSPWSCSHHSSRTKSKPSYTHMKLNNLCAFFDR